MSDEATSTSGAETTASSGDSTPKVVEPKSDQVAYETHRKLLGEKKRRDEQLNAVIAELDQLKSVNKEREEAELTRKEDYKQLLELREKELNDYKDKYQSAQAESQNAVKLQSFFDVLGDAVDRKYWGHVALEKIVIDPDTGSVDDMSVTKEVERFRTTYPEIIRRPNAAKIPSQAPLGAPAHASGRAAFEALAPNQQLRHVGELILKEQKG